MTNVSQAELVMDILSDANLRDESYPDTAKRILLALGLRGWDAGEHEGCGKDTERAIAAHAPAKAQGGS